MSMMRTRYRVQTGLTVMELAIVLGVAGLLIGGVWVAASAANEADKLNRTIDQIRQIVENTRTRASTTQAMTPLDFTAGTRQAAQQDLFPAETWLAAGGSGANCSVATPCYFAHPWDSGSAASVCGGGSYCVGSLAALMTATANTTNSGFVLLLRSLPQAACIKIVSRFIDIWDDIGLVGLGFRNGDGALPSTLAITNPPNIATISANCAAGNANSVYLAFRQNT